MRVFCTFGKMKMGWGWSITPRILSNKSELGLKLQATF